MGHTVFATLQLLLLQAAASNLPQYYLEKLENRTTTELIHEVNASTLLHCMTQCIWTQNCNMLSLKKGKTNNFQCVMSKYVEQTNNIVDSAEWLSYRVPNDYCRLTDSKFTWPTTLATATPTKTLDATGYRQYGVFSMVIKEPHIYLSTWGDKKIIIIDSSTGALINSITTGHNLWDMAKVPPNDDVIVTAPHANKVLKILPSSTVVYKDMGPEGAAFARGLAIWRGLLIVGGQDNKKIYFLNPNTASKDVLFSFDMPDKPHYICVCPSDYYVVSFPYIHKIYMYDCSHKEVLNADVPLARHCVCDDHNNVIVTSRSTSKMYRVTNTGVATTYFELANNPQWDGSPAHKMAKIGNKLYYQTDKGSVYEHDIEI